MDQGWGRQIKKERTQEDAFRMQLQQHVAQMPQVKKHKVIGPHCVVVELRDGTTMSVLLLNEPAAKLD